MPSDFRAYCSWRTSELRYNSDSNWQWVCLEKIVIECQLNIWKILGFRYFNNFNSKQDLFEAIIAYISNTTINVEDIEEIKADTQININKQYENYDL